jgi:uncharacterized protein
MESRSEKTLPRISAFLIIAFLWSWVFWFIGLNYLWTDKTAEGIDRFVWYFFIGVYGPSVSAIMTTFWFGGFRSVAGLLSKLLIWKTSPLVYVLIFFLPLLLVAFGLAGYALFINSVGRLDGYAVLTVPSVLWGALFAGPLGEELGWRGFLLPEFQGKSSAIKSSVIIGVIWYFWHTPLFLAPFGTLVSGSQLTLLPLITYLAVTVSLSCICTWAVNRSDGSVLIAILTHLFANAGLGLLFFPEVIGEYKLIYLLSTPAMAAFALWLVVRTGLR